MKRITFITCLLLLSQMVFSQDLIDGYNVNEETKLIEFSEVIETNKEFKELSHLAFNWALGYKSDNNLKKTQEGFENTETVHWKDNDGTLNILTTENFIANGGGNIVYQVNYTVKIQVRANSYKYTITNLRYKHAKKSVNNAKCFNDYTPFENKESGCGGGNASYRKIQERTLIQVNVTINGIKKYMNLKIGMWK